jgi:2-iminobutanoate/2-iminopropanoate deaminase
MTMTGKQEVRTGDAAAPGGAYSQGLVAGDFLYTAGMTPVDPRTGEVAGEDVGTQTRQVLENLRAVLAARGLTLDHVVKATVHLQDLRRDFAAYDAVYRSYFTPPFPVRTTVGSDLMGILVEIDLVAHLGS